LLVHRGLHASRRRRPDRRLAGLAGAERSARASHYLTYPRLFGGGTGLHDLPKAFRPACRRCAPPAADKRLPRWPRDGGQMMDGVVVAAICGFQRRRVPMAHAMESCEFCEHRSPPLPPSRRSVSVRASDLDAIAYPNAAGVAAIDLAVLRCRQPGPIRSAGVTKGRTAHLLSFYSCQARDPRLDIPFASRCDIPPTL